MFDLVTTIVIVGIFFYTWLFSQQQTATVIYLGFAAISTPIYMMFSYRVRIKSWRFSVITPDSAIDAAMTACQSSIQYLQLIRYSAFAFFVPANWVVYVLKEAQDKSLWLGLLIVNSILIIGYIIAAKMQQNRIEELKSHKLLKVN